MTFVPQEPPASTLLFAIRAIGYNFETAVADIVDNSISANATNVWIYSEPAEDPYFAFLDDGCGMNEAGLCNALCLASNREMKPDSAIELGRFGLGLKSASLSQCRRFTVVTKQGRFVYAMMFSLDEIDNHGKLGSMSLEKAEYMRVPEIQRLLKLESGTLVVWQDFDLLNKNTAKFEVSFRRLVDQAKRHVEYVFHRFYEDVAIYFNEQRVEKRDPFLLDSYGMQQEGRGMDVILEGHHVKITPYSLPYQNSLNEEQRRLLGNPKSIYDEQGLYLYRNKRLIVWGSWFRTEARSELNKLARVKVDVPSALDEIWTLDVKKSSARIPDKLKDKIRIAISDSVVRSQGAVRRPSENEAQSEFRVWERIPKGKDSVEYVINRNNPLYVQLKSRLGAEELGLFEHFVDELQDYLPKFQIHMDQADDKKIVNAAKNNIDQREGILRLARMIADVESARDREYMLDRYLKFEAYQSLKPYRTEILKEASRG